MGRAPGGIVHSYQKYDPRSFPPPTRPAPDLVSGAFQHLMTFGSMRDLTEEELARAVHLDPAQIRGLGPSLDALIALLEARRRKILATYEVEAARNEAASNYRDFAGRLEPPPRLVREFERAVRGEQIRDLERLWYQAGEETSPFSQRLLRLIERLGEKYQVEELAGSYQFTGRTAMSVPKALEVKEALAAIDRLLEQLRQARATARIGLIDMQALARFAEPGDVAGLHALEQQVRDYLRELAETQGLEHTREGYRLTPRAYRLFQSALLAEIFNDLKAARSGRHQGPVVGEGAVELPATRPYAFGDSVLHMDVPQSLLNAMIRAAGEGHPPHGGRVRLESRDIEIHDTKNNPRCATAVILDMSGSMRHGGQYLQCKRMGLALDGLVRSEYPGDFLQFIEMYTFAVPRHVSELPALMPRPVTMYDPVVRLKADMSDERITELDIPPHFTNIQHALHVARRHLSPQDTPNRQIILITDGLPTAHFEGEHLYLLYPPDDRTEKATMREARLCAREGITINIFLVPSWSQTSEDVQFAHRMVEASGGRVFFTGGNDLDRFVLWDYVKRKRKIMG